MPDYSKGKIYKIISPSNDSVIYYGSTINKLCVRLATHRNSYKLYLNDNNKYISSIEVVKNGDAQIILVENYPCKTKEELQAKEAEYIKNNECVNKNMPLRKPKEYYQDNIVKIKIYKREKFNCKACLGKYSKDHLSHHIKSKKHIKNLELNKELNLEDIIEYIKDEEEPPIENTII